MKCQRFQFDNSAGVRFCGECGASLDAVCPACAAENPPSFRFCGQCGHPLSPPSDEAPGSSSLAETAGQTGRPASLGNPPPPQPASFANGRYHVKTFLGEGGKKRVYLAHDTLLDRDVAFALIKTEGLDDEGRLRITREAQAMGRLGTHPHIVTVHDIG